MGDIEEPGVELTINEGETILSIGNSDCIGGYVPSIGETFRVNATLIDLAGDPITGGTNTVTLYNPDNSVNQTSVGGATHVGNGVWYEDFTTAAADDYGNYLIVWKNVTGAVTTIGKIKVFIDDPPI